MAQSGYTALQTYYTTVSGNQPAAGNLAGGELAINTADGTLFYKNTSGVVKLLAGGSGSSGGSGFSGYSGFSGATGSGGSGSSGLSGYSGYSGLGISGYSGLSGYSGAGSGSILTTANAFTNTNTFATTVSVGSTSTPGTLYVKGGNGNTLLIDNGGQQFTTFAIYNNGIEKAQAYWDQTNLLFALGTDVSYPMVLRTAATERMRIAASGGVSVGTLSDPGANNLLVNGTVQGSTFYGSGSGLTGTASSLSVGFASSSSYATSSGSTSYATSAGSATSASTAGGLTGTPNITVGTVTTGTINSSGTTLNLQIGGSPFIAMNNSFNTFFPNNDNTVSLGGASNRWTTVYATTGTINTSDGNEKQQIQNLTVAEIAVGKALKPILKSFKYNDAVQKKGADARIHFGIIAQDVQAAFVAQGLDPNSYGVFCSDVLTDGTVRLGVRYDELFALILAAI